MNKVWIAVIGVLVIGLGVYGYTSNKKEMAMTEQKAMEEKAMMEKKAMEEKAMMEKEKTGGEAMMKKDGATMEKKDGAMMSDKGSYVAYSPEKISWAKDGGKVVLFFHASWCPTCKALDSDLKAHLSDIPAGVTILDVDYDKSTELKQKYGVTTQHTLVQVDASGNLIAKWSGGNTLSTIVDKLK